MKARYLLMLWVVFIQGTSIWYSNREFMKGKLVLNIDRDHAIIITLPANSSAMGLVFIGANCTVLSALKREAFSCILLL